LKKQAEKAEYINGNKKQAKNLSYGKEVCFLLAKFLYIALKIGGIKDRTANLKLKKRPLLNKFNRRLRAFSLCSK
jgi:hypothetical protein